MSVRQLEGRMSHLNIANNENQNPALGHGKVSQH